MCIGAYTFEHPQYALILATNRDEYLDRPTANAHFHSFGRADCPTSVLAGRDLQAGGSWLGINRQTGRIALLTNITEPPAKYPTSRGALVSSFLLSSPAGGSTSTSLEDELRSIAPADARFAGFNLLLLAPSEDTPPGDDGGLPEAKRRRRLHYTGVLATNHGGGGAVGVRALSTGERACGAVSNGVDGAGGAEWPKVVRAREALAAVLGDRDEEVRGGGGAARSAAEACAGEEQSESEEGWLAARLFDLLSFRPHGVHITSRDALRHTVQVDPVPLPLHATAASTAQPATMPTSIPTPTTPAPTTTTPTPTPTTPTRTIAAPPPRPGATPPAPTPAPTSSTRTSSSSAHAAPAPPQPGATPIPPTTGSAAWPTPTPTPTRAAPQSTSSASAYYGTRLASVLLVRRDGRVFFAERDVWVVPPGDGDGGGGGDGDKEAGTQKPVMAPPGSERVFRFVLDGW